MATQVKIPMVDRAKIYGHIEKTDLFVLVSEVTTSRSAQLYSSTSQEVNIFMQEVRSYIQEMRSIIQEGRSYI